MMDLVTKLQPLRQQQQAQNEATAVFLHPIGRNKELQQHLGLTCLLVLWFYVIWNSYKISLKLTVTIHGHSSVKMPQLTGFFRCWKKFSVCQLHQLQWREFSATVDS
jgi:hypothetical protein